MGLRDVLERMRLVEPDTRVRPGAATAAPPSAAPRRETAHAAPRPVVIDPSIARVLERVAGRPRVDESVLAPAAVLEGDSGDFGALYRAAGVVDPAHGFTAVKVHELLTSEHLRELDPRARAQAVLALLQANPAGAVQLRDVVQDAVQRDEALDAGEEALRARYSARADEVARENDRLQAEIDALAARHRERMAANDAQLAAERAQLERWRLRKQVEERRLFEALAPFLEENPVTTPQPGEPQAASGAASTS